MIDPHTRIGAVTLKVKNLARMETFYRQVVGLHLQKTAVGLVALGTPDETLVRLREVENGRFLPQATGLYHLALRVPTRADLAHWLRHYAGKGAPHWQGGSNHGVSEALYLNDPEGNGIEIYCDQPRSQWQVQADGQIAVFVHRLDVNALIREAPAAKWRQLPPATDMGHVHFKVGDIDQTRHFYANLCGFQIKTAYQRSALFVAAGDYHHHIGLNTWHSLGASPLPADGYGLAETEIWLNGRSAQQQLAARLQAANWPVRTENGDLLVTDPSGIHLRFKHNQKNFEEKQHE